MLESLPNVSEIATGDIRPKTKTTCVCQSCRNIVGHSSPRVDWVEFVWTSAFNDKAVTWEEADKFEWQPVFFKAKVYASQPIGWYGLIFSCVYNILYLRKRYGLQQIIIKPAWGLKNIKWSINMRPRVFLDLIYQGDGWKSTTLHPIVS